MTFSSLRPLCISPIERYAVRGRSGCDMRGRSRCLAHSSCRLPYSTWRNRILPHLFALCRRYSPRYISASVARFYRHRGEKANRITEEVHADALVVNTVSGERPAILQFELIAAIHRSTFTDKCGIRHELAEVCRSHHRLLQRA